MTISECNSPFFCVILFSIFSVNYFFAFIIHIGISFVSEEYVMIILLNGNVNRS